MLKKILPYTLLLISMTTFSQKDCNCFNNEAYNQFVKQEQTQTVTEGNDALFTFLLNQALNEDVIVEYKITSITANINTDITPLKEQKFIIPTGNLKATMHIATIADNINELNESFTIEITKAYTKSNNVIINNKHLVRTRIISDNKVLKSFSKVYLENGVVKTIPKTNNIEISNMNGASIKNENLKTGTTYFIKATIDNQNIFKTIVF